MTGIIQRLCLSLACVVLILAGNGQAAAQDHQHHNMSPEMFAELREKVPLYQEFTDEEIVQNMEDMGPNYNVYVSDKDVQGNVGILALAHGFHEPGDTQFKEGFVPISKTYPTALGFGMAMMSSAHIQSAVDELTAAGAETIVVIPTTYTSFGKLALQWEYVFGQHDTAPWMSVAIVETEANVIIAKAMSDSPVVADIMLTLANELSTEPENELLIVASHGPANAEENVRELVLLENQADMMRANSKFSAIKVITLQDDAPSAIRAANVDKFRSWVETATQEGNRVLVVSNLLTTSSVHKKIERDLEGLSYDFNTTGLMLHSDFQNWIEDTVARSLEQS